MITNLRMELLEALLDTAAGAAVLITDPLCQDVLREGVGGGVPPPGRDQHPLLGRGAPTRAPAGECVDNIYQIYTDY